MENKIKSMQIIKYIKKCLLNTNYNKNCVSKCILYNYVSIKFKKLIVRLKKMHYYIKLLCDEYQYKVIKMYNEI